MNELEICCYKSYSQRIGRNFLLDFDCLNCPEERMSGILCPYYTNNRHVEYVLSHKDFYDEKDIEKVLSLKN